MSPIPPLALEILESRDVPAASFETLPILPTGDLAARDRVRTIAALGQQLGRRPDVFMKIGDSNTDLGPWGSNGYLKPLGAPDYNPDSSGLAALGQNLVETWSTFRHAVDGGFNSFDRPSSTAYPGYSLLDVLPRVSGEIAATNAGVALIMLGTNDVSKYGDPGLFEGYLEQLVGTLEAAGVVPILSAIPENRSNGDAQLAAARAFNQAIADASIGNHLPYWNLFRQESTLPNSGLDSYGVHLSASYNTGNFTSTDLLYGQNVHNLGALQVLDWYRQQVVGGALSSAPPLPTWTSLAGHAVYAVGRDAGQGPTVSIYDADTHVELNRFNAFEASFGGGVRVAVADVNGDGVADVVAGAGPTGGPVVAVFNGVDGSRIAAFLVFEPSFRGGVTSVGAADLDGDGKAEIVVGAGNGGAPAVAVFNGGDFKERERFFAFDSSFRGGVNVAIGNFAGMGTIIVAGSGLGGGPQVAFFAVGAVAPLHSYFVDDPNLRGGAVVSAGDFNGDGFDELATGRLSGGSRVDIRDPANWTVVRSIAGTGGALAGVRLGTIARTGRTDELLVGNGPGATVALRSYDSLAATAVDLPPNDPLRAYGIFVG